MKSISDHKAALDKIAANLGLTGRVTDYNTSILAYAIYEASVNQLVVVNENSPDKAANINSQIDYAMDNLYSVFRGRNNIIELSLTTLTNKSIKKFDLLFNGKGYNIYALEDLDSVSAGLTKSLKCIIAKDLVTITPSLIKSYYIDFYSEDISEAIYVFKNGIAGPTPTEFTEITFTERVSDCLDNDYPLAITCYNFGVRLYFSSKIDPYSGFKLTYFSYTDVEVSLDDFSKLFIPGFTINPGTVLTKYVPRDTIDSGIGTRAKNNILIQNRVRSTTDVLDLFNQLFVDASLQSAMEIVDNEINIYYVPIDELVPIPQERVDEYASLFSKYVNLPVVVNQATKVSIDAECTLYHSSATLSKDSVFDLFSSKNNLMNLELNKYRIIAEINALHPSITYSELVMKVNDVVQETISIDNQHYAEFNVSIIIKQL